MRHIATTGGITSDMIRDLIAASMESRFGTADRFPGGSNGSGTTAVPIQLVQRDNFARGWELEHHIPLVQSRVQRHGRIIRQDV